MIDSEKMLIIQQLMLRGAVIKAMARNKPKTLTLPSTRSKGAEPNPRTTATATSTKGKRPPMTTIGIIQGMKRARRKQKTTSRAASGPKTSGVTSSPLPMTSNNNMKRRQISTVKPIKARRRSNTKNTCEGAPPNNNRRRSGKTSSTQALSMPMKTRNLKAFPNNNSNNTRRSNRIKMTSINNTIKLMKRRCVGRKRSRIRKRIGRKATSRSLKSTDSTLKRPPRPIRSIHLKRIHCFTDSIEALI